MYKAILVRLLCLLTLLTAGSNMAFAGEKLVVYSSVKESLMGKLRESFIKKYPEVTLDYQSGSSDALLAKLITESNGGKINADIFWTLNVSDFYKLKNMGILEKYTSPFMNDVVNPFSDYDGSFTAVRLGTVGITYNTRLVKTPPTTWHDLAKSEYKDAVKIADPNNSGAAAMCIIMLQKEFGWEFWSKLRANDLRLSKGAIQVVNETASGDAALCFGVDYITNDTIQRGAPINLAYPPEMVVVPSPVAIIKGTSNLNTAQKFIDFLLSIEAQTIIANEGALPVHKKVTANGKFPIPSSEEALQRAIKVNYQDLSNIQDELLKKFNDIMSGGSSNPTAQ